MYRPEVKLSLKKGGRFVLSKGRAELLSLIEKEGSITRAAKKMGMSYRHAWGLVNEINKAVGSEVVTSKRGGATGGGTRLTMVGSELVDEYNTLYNELERLTKYGPMPALTVDGVVHRSGKVLLVKRARPPFKGRWALPGGFVETGERVEEAVVREVLEETSVNVQMLSLVGVYSDPGRDPRGHTVSVVFLLEPESGKARGGDDASDAKWFPLDKLPELAFDHREIIDEAIKCI